MNSTKTFSISLLALTALLGAGCVGVGPNTQQGAVAGGVLGAAAGAIIGHNSRDIDTLGGAVIGGTAGAIAGGTLGNSVDNQRGTLYGYPRTGADYPAGTAPTAVTRSLPPPPSSTPAETIPASPAPNAVWIPGYWSYNGRGYEWIGGRWEIPPANARSYVAAHWEDHGDRYVYVPGYWQ